MDTELKCNRLTCRRGLAEKAVVTTCSHIFCVECANELFNAARLCPACETTLSERDDIVVCSLNPTNDYKTSVLSGLSPSVILEICSRAISFWQYQIHQENSFQQAVVRNVNDKNALLQKQFENVIREANGEINLLSNKIGELERDLEIERRKIRDMQDASRDRDKEYQKLKTLYDKAKRKALLGVSHPMGHDVPIAFSGSINHADRQVQDDCHAKQRTFGGSLGNAVDLGAVLGGMEANGIQRTPIINRTGPSFAAQQGSAWTPQHLLAQVQHGQPQTNKNHRQAFGLSDYSYRGTISDQSESASEVENLLVPKRPSVRANNQGWAGSGQRSRTNQHVFAPTSKRITTGFRPAR